MHFMDTFARTRRIWDAPAAIVTSLAALAILGACASNTAAASTPTASIVRSVEVNATPSEVWAVIGPFCAIKDWLPPIATCTQDGASPPTRTLVTRDGAATFVEIQTARNDARHTYSYAFRSSPLPVSHYNSTVAVRAASHGHSIVTWRATYQPDPGRADEANQALSGVYQSGLDAIRARFGG